MTGRQDEEPLVAASRAGDREAFGELVRRYQDRLYPTLLRLVGNPDDALDLLQDAFLMAYRKLRRFEGKSSFYTWLYRIAVNLALSSRRRRHAVTLGFEDEAGQNVEPSDDPSRTDPSLPLERAERERRVQEALDELSADHRAVVVLKDLDGLPYEEISAILSIPIGTVRSRLHRARRELRELLADLIEMEPTFKQED